jgi:hypothetical protein
VLRDSAAATRFRLCSGARLVEEIPSWKDYLIASPTSAYDHVIFNSEIERNFVEGLEEDKRVKIYLKLPAWFTVATPVGEYDGGAGFKSRPRRGLHVRLIGWHQSFPRTAQSKLNSDCRSQEDVELAGFNLLQIPAAESAPESLYAATGCKVVSGSTSRSICRAVS